MADLGFVRFTPLPLVFTSILLASMAVFFLKGYKERVRAIRLKREGFVGQAKLLLRMYLDSFHQAMPPHHPIFGHLLVLAHMMGKLPKDAHPHHIPDQLRQKYPEMGPIFYLDAWPFMTLTLVVASPTTIAQITTEHVLPKFPAIKEFLYPLANGKDIVSMDGREWKYWRNIFNPGFSASHLMTLVPDFVKETTVFCKLLQDHARTQDMFQMKTLTDDLAMDVIGKVVL